MGKPLTRRYDPEVGRYRFLGHAEVGAEVAEASLLWLRFPKEVAEGAKALVRRHMDRPPRGKRPSAASISAARISFPPSPTSWRQTAWAPGGGGGGLGSAQELSEATREPLPERPFLSGEEVMALLGLRPGPEVGRALAFLLEAQAEGRVRSPEEAKALLLYWKGGGQDPSS